MKSWCYLGGPWGLLRHDEQANVGIRIYEKRSSLKLNEISNTIRISCICYYCFWPVLKQYNWCSLEGSYIIFLKDHQIAFWLPKYSIYLTMLNEMKIWGIHWVLHNCRWWLWLNWNRPEVQVQHTQSTKWTNFTAMDKWTEAAATNVVDQLVRSYYFFYYNRYIPNVNY